jgi:cytidylate kinase
MENRLFEYMNKRIGGDFNISRTVTEPGPVITISRQTGCGARGIAWAICEELNKRKMPVETDGNRIRNEGKWRFISREILQESAEQLNLDPAALKNVIDDKNRGMMDQIVGALSQHSHKSDQKILNTVHDVIRQFANNGKVIIIGRGGASICHDIKLSLHVRLVAPEDWRIAEIARRLDFSKAYASEYVHKRDEERQLLITRLLGKKPDSSTYDAELNRSRFTEKELADAIIQLALIKGLIKT